MSSPTKSIKLAYGVRQQIGDVLAYKVITVKNSTVFSPGQVLCKAEVDDLCDGPRFDVTIVGLREDA